MIRVVKVNRIWGEARSGIAYVGRAWLGWVASPLGNPFRVRPNDRNQDRGSVARTVETALDRYRDWLNRHPRRDELLADLWEATNHGTKPLGCWCVDATAGDGSPVVCHAQILAEMLRERFVPG